MPFETTSVAADIQPQQQQNAFGQLGEVAQTVNALNQNKMFQANQIAGQYLEQSIGPNGQPDPAKLNQFLLADPRTAPKAAEIMQNAFNIQGQGITNTTNQQTLAGTRMANMSSALGAVPKGSSADKYLAVINQGVSQGLWTADDAASVAGGNIPSVLDFPLQAQMAAIKTGSAGEQEAQGGNIVNVNTGGAITPIVQNRFAAGGPTSAAISGAAIPTTLTPGEKVARVGVIDPKTGVQESVPVAALATDTGQPKPLPGIADTSGVAQTSLAPGAAEGRTVVGRASGAQYATDLQNANGSAQRIAQLKEIETLLQSPQGKTGPGTQVVNGWRNWLLGNIPIFSGDPSAPTQMQIQSATQDELKKYMTRAAGDAAAQYGQGTNEKLAVAASGNANPDMSNLANQDVTRMNIAMERAQQARLAAFQQTGLPAEQYSTWASNWNRNVDPRAFMLDMLNPAERQKFLASVKTPAEKAAILRGKGAAEAAGLFSESDIPR